MNLFIGFLLGIISCYITLKVKNKREEILGNEINLNKSLDKEELFKKIKDKITFENLRRHKKEFNTDYYIQINDKLTLEHNGHSKLFFFSTEEYNFFENITSFLDEHQCKEILSLFNKIIKEEKLNIKKRKEIITHTKLQALFSQSTH